MQIDRSNYEIWVTDWLDGNLNSLQVEQLKLFLDKNPDLREEFDDLTSLNLVTSAASFRHKEHLKKSLSDISEDQFEYLCASYLENDLSENQKEELQEIINLYPDRKRTFNLIQKTILPPAKINYRHKNHLLRRTPLHNVLRISVIGLSGAAAISIILIIFPVKPVTDLLKQSLVAHNLLPYNTVKSSSQVIAKERTITGSASVPDKKKIDKMLTATHMKKSDFKYDTLKSFSDNFPVRKIDNPVITINKIPVNQLFDLKKKASGNRLIASNQTIDIPAMEDQRSQVGKFISKTFREKLLKEKKPKDTPLNGFEIAEAGITGINKLFGWQMVLEKKDDENGHTKSVYFSSEILKFNTPIKKREPQQ
jgi:hypothetical protein